MTPTTARCSPCLSFQWPLVGSLPVCPAGLGSFNCEHNSGLTTNSNLLFSRSRRAKAAAARKRLNFVFARRRLPLVSIARPLEAAQRETTSPRRRRRRSSCFLFSLSRADAVCSLLAGPPRGVRRRLLEYARNVWFASNNSCRVVTHSQWHSCLQNNGRCVTQRRLLTHKHTGKAGKLRPWPRTPFAKDCATGSGPARPESLGSHLRSI